MALPFILFAAGTLTILLPCILPLIPIVLGVSVAGSSRLRPVLTVAGMIVSFVGFSFLLLLVLRQFVFVADLLRIGTYHVLLLFGLGFAFHNRTIKDIGALLGSLFFWEQGVLVVACAALVAIVLMEIGGRVAAALQGLGSTVQQTARSELGEDAPLTAFIMGLTLGLVWVPCAGPALGFAYTLVSNEPGLRALFLLTCYSAGVGLPLLIIGYGGQFAVSKVRLIAAYSGSIKKWSGYLLIITALALQFHWFRYLETYLVQHTAIGNLGVDIEMELFGDEIK